MVLREVCPTIKCICFAEANIVILFICNYFFIFNCYLLNKSSYLLILLFNYISIAVIKLDIEPPRLTVIIADEILDRLDEVTPDGPGYFFE